MKVGEVIASLEFSDSEKDRIAEALRESGSPPLRALTQASSEIHDKNFWRAHQKAFNVPGFRWGAQVARQIVVKKALDSIKTIPGHKARPIWKLYRACIIEFVVSHLATLNDLLLNEELIDGELPLTERIFASIRHSLPLYDIPLEHVTQLYLLWGFDRTANFDSIMRDDTLRVPTAQKLLAKQNKDLVTLLTDRIEGLAVELRVESLGAINSELRELRGRIESLNSTTVLSAQVNDRLANMEASYRSLEATVSKVNLIAPSSNAIQVDIPHTLDESVAKSLREQINSLTAAVDRHEKRLLDLPRQKAPSTVHSTKGVDETWHDLLARVRATCSRSGFELKTDTAARILFELVRRARVICCQTTELWVSALSARAAPDIRHESASPLWIDARDWREAIDFISDYEAPPRVLFLMDFDVGIQEAYLLPAVRAWMAATPRQCEHRIVLVPSSPSLEDVSPRIFEASITIANELDLVAMVDRASRSRDEELQPLWRQTVPSRPLAYEETSSSELTIELTKVFDNFGTTLPVILGRRFISLMQGITAFTGDASAAMIAGECTLLPWYRRTRSEGAALVLAETLRSIYGAA